MAQALAEAKATGVDRLDAQLLLARAVGRSRSWLLAHDDAILSTGQASGFRSELHRRAGGEPLAYIVGEKEFHGLLLQVNASVLVPRPETEALVDWGLEILDGALAGVARPDVLDLGTGSGAIGLALKHSRPPARVVATDISADALDVAKANADRLGLAIEFQGGSWWAGLAGRRFHLIVSNPPYVAPDDPHLAALGHEPRMALTPGGDGLEALATIAGGAAGHLAAAGWLLLEHGHDQASAVQALLQRHGYCEVQTRLDLAGRPRCTGGRL